MKDVIRSLLKRNGIIIAIYAAAMTVLFFMPQYSMGIAFYAILFLPLGLIWANGMLVNHMSRLLATLLTAVITLVVGAAVVLLTMQAQRLFGT